MIEQEKKKFEVTSEELFTWIEKNRILNLEQIIDSIQDRFDKRESFVACVTKPNRKPITLIKPQQFCGICTHYRAQELYSNPQAKEPHKCSLHKKWIIDVPFLGYCESFKLDKKELEKLQTYSK